MTVDCRAAAATCRLAVARCSRSSSVQACRYSPLVSPQQDAEVPDRLLCHYLGYRWSSATAALSTPSPAGCTVLSTNYTRPSGVLRPTVWNSLSVELRDETENTFRQSLKTLLFTVRLLSIRAVFLSTTVCLSVHPSVCQTRAL